MECNCAEKHGHSCQNVDLDLLEPYLVKYQGPDAKGNLSTILQIAQDIYGYIPTEVVEHIARRLKVKPAKVLGVITFYTRFRTKPIGKNLISVCHGTACHVNGAQIIENAIKDTLGVDEGDISKDGLFTYSNVACVGCCSLAPVIMIGEKTYGGLTKEKTAKILKDIEQKEKSL